MAPSFKGMTVVSFESRRAAEMAKLIEKSGGNAITAPSMRELPMDDCPEAIEFAKALKAGQVDILILLTGVGTKLLNQAITDTLAPDSFADHLAKITTVSRGPKPVAALRELGVKPTHTVPEPNTWDDLLSTLDTHCPVDGKRVAVQEYGQSNPRLIDGLKERGAQVQQVPIYRWGLPLDLEPMRDAIKKLIAGDAGVVLFTSAQQMKHVFQVAEQDGCASELREALRRVCIGSIGPVASEAITEQGLTVDYEPDAPHMPQLVRELARRGAYLLERKQASHASGVDTNRWRRIDGRWDKMASDAGDGTAPPTIDDSVFLKACRREPVPHTPVWIMRQAGRYQRAYREVRAGISMLDLCKTPELMAEVTLMAVDRLGVDAAIIFADILPIIEPFGLKLEYVKGDGPVIYNPVQSRQDLQRLATPDIDALSPVFEAIKLTRRSLRPDIALIGFAGAPFTVASYVIEGGKSSNYNNSKSMMYRDPATWHGLLEKLSLITVDYLAKQIEAGADAVQLFDSWAGSLSPDDYREYVLPHMRTIFAGIKQAHPTTPILNFATGNPALLPIMKEALLNGDESRPGDVIGLDWRIDLREGWDMLNALPGGDVAVQGNLDPISLYASSSGIEKAAAKIIEKTRDAKTGELRNGHIFNLGHGVLPDMDPTKVADLIDAVHALSAR